jgi:hypothetical protein
MSIWNNIFGPATADLVKNTDSLIDNAFTSDEERLEARNKFQEIITGFKVKVLEYDAIYQEMITRRWESDNNSDSWLAKNVRPLALVYLLLIISLLAITDGNFGGFSIKESWIQLFTALTLTTFAGYYGSRAIEKITKGRKDDTR